MFGESNLMKKLQVLPFLSAIDQKIRPDFQTKPTPLNLDYWLWFDFVPYMINHKTSNFAKISWFFSKSADHRYQVWHKISVGVLDRVSMVPFLGLKSLIQGLSKFSTSSLTLPRRRRPTPMWSTFLEPPDPCLSFEISFATSRTLLYFDLIWTLAFWLSL